MTRVAVCAILTVFAGLSILGRVGQAGASGPSNAVGIYPSSVSFTKVLRGGEYLQTIGIINGSSQHRVFRFSLHGRMARWLTIVARGNLLMRRSTVTVPPGTSTVQLRLEVPPQTVDGTYTGALDIVARPLKGSHPEGSIPVSVGVQVDVSAQVTGTQVIAGALINVSSYRAIEVGDPLPIFSTIKNSSNVIVSPVFRLRITRGNKVVYDHTSLGQGLIPGSLSKSEVVWPGPDTGSQVLGAYEVHLSVLFPSHSLGTRELSFHLDPQGSLRRGGRLLSLKLLDHPKVGDAAYVGASLVNTGEVQADSSFEGELYRNGVLLGSVTSFGILLAPGQSGVATLTVKLPQDGTYRITGVGSFAGAQSNSLSLSFRLGSPTFPILYPIAGGAAVVLLALFLLWRRSTRNRPEVSRSQGGRDQLQGPRRHRHAHRPSRRHVKRRPKVTWFRVHPDRLIPGAQ